MIFDLIVGIVLILNYIFFLAFKSMDVMVCYDELSKFTSHWIYFATIDWVKSGLVIEILECLADLTSHLLVSIIIFDFVHDALWVTYLFSALWPCWNLTFAQNCK